MNVVPMSSVVGSAAGAPLSQTSGSEAERAKQDTSAQARQTDTEKKAADAAGIGQTQEDQESSDRDADGRRLWEATEKSQHHGDEENQPSRQSKDPSGMSGTSLDLTG